MTFLKNLLRRKGDPRERMRPLWHKIVETSRQERWYANLGVEDSVGGRFDMITVILCFVLLRMEREEQLVPPSVLLTELFVADMDGQLRESGINDVVVGKHIGKLMATLGGRLGAYRDGLAADEDAALTGALRRNVNMADEARAEELAAALRDYGRHLAALDAEAIMAGDIGQ